MRKNGGIRMPEEVYRGRAPPPKPIAYRAVDNVRIDVEMKRRHFRRDFHSPMALLMVHRHAIIILCSQGDSWSVLRRMNLLGGFPPHDPKAVLKGIDALAAQHADRRAVRCAIIVSVFEVTTNAPDYPR